MENNEFKIINSTKKSNNKTLDILNVLSITELVIPFLFNNDPCRSLMGSKMHTQAIPLLYSNNPYVITNYNTVNNLLSSRFIYSMCSGVVQEVDSSRIIILDDKDRLIYYYLYPFNVVDYNSILLYKPIVWEGEKVCVGKILAIPNDLKNLEFSIGFNNFVNYSFYDGYEHEDAIIINKDLVIEDILTSISFNIYEDCLYLKKFDCLELVVQKFFKDSGKKNIDEEEIYEYYSSTYYKYFLSGEELSFKIKYEIYHYKSTYFDRLLRLLFPEEKVLLTKNKSLTIKHGGEGRLVKYEILSNYDLKQSDDFYDDLNISYMVLRFFIAKIDRINIGDKLCGRHGNKGVVSKISETIDLPYTFNDSSPYSITSPIGSLARINLGQFLEGVCGYKSLNYNCRTKAPINLFESYLYSNLYFNLLNNSYNLYKNSCLINTINENYLRDFKTGYKLKNFNFLSVPYYLKLMHTSKSKFNYRTVGRYNSMTQQPVEGKNVSGGQKFGEMEIWALEAHGSSYNIQELSLLKTNIKLFKKFETTHECSESFKITKCAELFKKKLTFLKKKKSVTETKFDKFNKLLSDLTFIKKLFITLFPILPAGLRTYSFDNRKVTHNSNLNYLYAGFRVDYSGRATIVPYPSLPLQTVGLPSDMLYHRVRRHHEKGEVNDNTFYESSFYRHNILDKLEFFEELLPEYSVTVNRAPTLHKMNVQVFNPMLVEGESVQFNPLLCAGYNADFDGDQMGIFSLLKNYSMNEALHMLGPLVNLHSPTTKNNVFNLTQGMLAGYYSLSNYNYFKLITSYISNNYTDVLEYFNRSISIDSPILLRSSNFFYYSTYGRSLLNYNFNKK
ncbi:DNA-directed RNA polymerase (apicoplast) [Theileria orientalis strain Shintoku]|uniref:Bifunctional DNA-directed RNA polymerase subunit beta-beta' n=1 Tax=Theileria orientalis strain Shintoku TaxID=869250 RepID=J7MH45_THEOR|nr:DNA-directed RNA polymerase [Theileria orientalis strain Shintoku]BAM42531.1 DNA-directed RNA polymerase [Theileria orientalis strain Shintoku]|eukprot:XP_012965622.1 DNA-directed RNA polymerase [Theileria orientalis strain Shintoku]